MAEAMACNNEIISEIEWNSKSNIEKIFLYINRYCFEDITARQVALMFNWSYSYFSRQFKKTADQSFSEYLNMIRIEEAERLLLNTEMSITEIAMNTGYSDVSYFIKRFKEVKKLTPAQLRKKRAEKAVQIHG